jgi:probable rRNA maturation factor
VKPPDRGHELTIGYGLPRRGLPSAASFRLWMTRALPSRSRPVTISLRLVDEAEGRSLNADFRGRDYATNVLSFPAGDARLEDGTRLLGDIAICAPVVAREAVEQSKPPRSHFAHLTVHGVLHLLGYDHVEPSDAESMERKECLLLRQLGFPNPYKT